jgi:hypothetical protein
MKFSLLLIGIAILSGCAQNTPIDRYNQYASAIKDSSNTELLKNYWSSTAVQEGLPVINDTSEGGKLIRDTALQIIRFPEQLETVTFKTQEITENKACVLVTGKGQDNYVVFNIPYIRQNSKWLINGEDAELSIEYVGNEDDLPTTPKCVAKE